MGPRGQQRAPKGQPLFSHRLGDIQPFLPCRHCPGEAGEGPALKKQESPQIEWLKEEYLSERDKNPKQAEAENTFYWPVDVSPQLMVSANWGSPASREQSRKVKNAMMIAHLNVTQRF